MAVGDNSPHKDFRHTAGQLKGMDLLSLLVLLLIIGLVVWFAFWMVDSAGIPAPMNWIIKGIVLVLGLLWLFGGGHSLPNITL